MANLEMWLKQATKCLSADAAAKVRGEIEEHFEQAREAAALGGATEADAAQAALVALGNARAANRAYRRVLLTKNEARILRESAWEAGAVCAHGWLRWFVLFWTAATLIAGIWIKIGGWDYLANLLLMASIALGLCASPMFLPLFTPVRGRMYRATKLTFLAAVMVFGLASFKQPWLIFVCIWPALWNEWNRMSIRRKMPQADWPRHLYL